MRESSDTKVTNLILTMGIRFWQETVDTLKIRDVNHCDKVLKELAESLGIILRPFDVNRDNDLVLSLGVTFWRKTSKDQNIKDITHCQTVISYLQGFLDDINQDETDKPPKSEEVESETLDSEEYQLTNLKELDFDISIPNSEEYQLTNPKQVDFTDDIHQEDNGKTPFPEKVEEKGELPHSDLKISPINYKSNSKAKKKLTICDYCGLGFISPFSMKTHIETNHPEKKEVFNGKYLVYDCVKPNCTAIYYSRKTLVKHYRSYHKELKETKSKTMINENDVVGKCKECDKKFKILSDLEDHNEEHKYGLGTKLFRCDICQTKYNTRRRLEEHKKKHEDLSSVCPHCGITLESKKDMFKHLVYHREKTTRMIQFFCDSCNATFETEGKKHYHLYKYHNVKAFHCDLCGLKCNNLKLHKQRTHGDKNLKCEYCEKKFSTKYYVDRHVKLLHLLEKNYKFKCDYCGKKFIRSTIFEGHLNMHLGLKPYKCNGCNTAFQNDSNLNAHIRKSCKNPKILKTEIKKA